MFTLTPRKEGTVDLLGFTYLLSGVIRGRQIFPVASSKASAAGQEPETDPSLSLIVTAAMPRLVIQTSIPSKLSLLSGEVSKVIVTLSNHGAAPLTALRVAFQHPHILAFGRREETDRPMFQNDTAVAGPGTARGVVPIGVTGPTTDVVCAFREIAVVAVAARTLTPWSRSGVHAGGGQRQQLV